MISDKKFRPEEFFPLVNEFAEKVNERTPVTAKVTLRQDVLTGGYIISVVDGRRSQHTLLTLNRYGNVVMTNIFGELQ